MPPQALAAIATLISFAPQGNGIEFKLDRGSAEMVWISPRSFHFRRALEGPLPVRQAAEPQTDPVALQVDDTPGAVRIRSKYLDVAIQKRGLLVNVHRIDGAALMADLSEPKEEGAGVAWERAAAPGVRFYGLGPRSEPELDLRGKNVDTFDPFLISTAGYGESHFGRGGFHFDFTAVDRYRVKAPQVDYYFYYGPTPKEIFGERKGEQIPRPPANGLPPSWETLRNDLLAAVHQTMSSTVSPEFNLDRYTSVSDELTQRARQFASLLPNVTPGTVALSSFRTQLSSFFFIYEIDKRDLGRPIWHALPFEFPDDAECAHHADEFMLGDEMLVAPIYESGAKRTVYLPPGNWTSLDTNREFPGRQTIAVDTSGLPVFARNGTIVPLDSNGGIGLHYFPKLGAEFFLLEKETGEYTQVHAAPAVDIMRLEIESKRDRDYQWVVHHIERPAEVGFEERKYRAVHSVAALADGAWFYDAGAKNLIIRVRVKAGEDNIINLSW